MAGSTESTVTPASSKALWAPLLLGSTSTKSGCKAWMASTLSAETFSSSSKADWVQPSLAPASWVSQPRARMTSARLGESTTTREGREEMVTPFTSTGNTPAAVTLDTISSTWEQPAKAPHPNKTQRAKAKTRRMALPIRIIFKALPFQAKPAKPTGPPTVHGESILFYPEWLCCVNSPGKALDFFPIPDYNKNLSGNWSEAPANALAWTALPTRGAVYCVKYIT